MNAGAAAVLRPSLESLIGIFVWLDESTGEEPLLDLTDDLEVLFRGDLVGASQDTQRIGRVAQIPGSYPGVIAKPHEHIGSVHHL